MPIFEYSCLKCGHRFEKLQRDAAGQTADCPACGSGEVKREISSFSSGAAISPTSGAACFSGG